MKRTLLSLGAATLALALLLISGAADASAHEQRTVAGKYNFVVGFINEPAYLEEPNGISLAVTNAQSKEPVEGVEKTLKADVVAGGQTKTVELRARFGQKGAYITDLIPTRVGTWVFRFTGTIDGTAIDERFESGPGRFNDVQSKSELQFPVKQPSIAELVQQIQRPGTPAEAASASASLASADDVQRALDRADSARSTAIGFGIAGVLTGVLGLALAGYALATRRKGADTGGRPGREPV